MKIRFYLLAAILLAGFVTCAYADKKDLDSKTNVSYKNNKSEGKKLNSDENKKSSEKNNIVKLEKEDQNPEPVKAPDNDSTFVLNKKNDFSGDEKDNDEKIKIVGYDVKDELEELSKSKDDKQNIYLKMCKHEDDDDHEYGHHGDDEHEDGKDDINEVPVPAALWSFGSGLLGLVGAKRKSA